MRPRNRPGRIRERTHEPENIGRPFEAARHRLCSSVVAWTSDSQPGKPAPPIWLPAGRDNRRGSWTLWIRPGRTSWFQHLVAEVCTGEVGAVLCIEASRL